MDENNVFNSFSFKKWVTRLRTKLVRERLLREQADILSDEDIDKLIGYISAGFKLRGPGALLSHTQLAERVHFVPKDDNYIFDEIKAFYDTNRSLRGLHNTIPNEFQHNHKFNHRLAKSVKAANPRARVGQFVYNRRFNASAS
uniref:Uncharacterized protein n=1 Tax=Ditylenchus dipsaci TaxID=166011 RepID=A0A915D4E5_9BILA